MSIYLSTAHFEDIQHHCKECWPEEACALLIGTLFDENEYRVSSVALSNNIAADRKRYFEIDPGLRIRLEKELRDKTESIIGVFHSHPNGPALPSRQDEKMIIERHLVWLIAASTSSGIADLNAFTPNKETGFSPTTLTIQNGGEKQHV